MLYVTLCYSIYVTIDTPPGFIIIMATSDSTSSDEEYQSADEGDVRTGIEHLKVSDVTHQHVKEPVKETEEQCSHPTEPHVDNDVSESVVSHSPEGSREAGGCGKEEEGEFVAGLDNKYVCEGATISPEGKVELTEEQIKVSLPLQCHCSTIAKLVRLEVS